MTICTGCGIKTNATICCPICLKYNKSVFYCTQECYEMNYSKHKKIHYFIKKAIHVDIHKEIHEANEVIPKKEELPVVILNDGKEGKEEKERNEEITNQTSFPKGKIYSSNNFAYGINENIENEKIGINEKKIENRKSLNTPKNIEEYSGGRAAQYENKKRKKGYNNDYTEVNEDNFITNKEDEKTKQNKEGNMACKSKSSLLSNCFSLLFNNKGNFVLPYYENMGMDNKRRLNSKEMKAKIKITPKEYMELKKHFKTKRIASLVLILIMLTLVVIICVYPLYLHLDKMHNKNINILTEQAKEISINKNYNKNKDFQDINAYLHAIEELKKEVNEMKEVLYIHNVYMQKHFNISSSYSIFNNLNNKKEKFWAKKKSEDQLNNISTFNFSKEYTAESLNKNTTEMENAEPTFKQLHYDVSNINERTYPRLVKTYEEKDMKTAERVIEMGYVNKEKKLIIEETQHNDNEENNTDIKDKNINEENELEVANTTTSFINKERNREHDIVNEKRKDAGKENKNRNKENKREDKHTKVNENLINHHKIKHDAQHVLKNIETEHAPGTIKKVLNESNEMNERKTLINKMGKNKQQTI